MTEQRVNFDDPNWWKTEGVRNRFSETFSEYLLLLIVEYETENKRTSAVFTGFPMPTRRVSVWMTAGHVISSIEKLLAHPQVRILRVYWLDVFCNPNAARIPFDIRQSKPIRFEQFGVDLGFILLNPNTSRLLVANENRDFIDPSTCGNTPDEECEGYYLVGAPSELTIANIAEKPFEEIVTIASTVAIPIERIECDASVGDPDFWKNEDAFYGRLVGFEEQLASIAGMSGGPVFCVKHDEQGAVLSRLIGIQSAWLRSERIIRATQGSVLTTLLDALDNHIRNLSEE